MGIIDKTQVYVLARWGTLARHRSMSRQRWGTLARDRSMSGQRWGTLARHRSMSAFGGSKVVLKVRKGGFRGRRV